MGVVYRAWDPVLRRAVALKGMPEFLEQRPDLSGLLMREAQALAKLNHPNIEMIHGTVVAEDGRQFLVLEHLDGELLSVRLSRGPMPLADALGTCRDIAAALESAHREGVLHRDLKPSNVMITRAGPKVLDFGLTTRLGNSDDREQSSAVPWPGTLDAAGTSGYASPEQMRGEAVDRRTDLFSLGCILYECLSGHRAFPGATPAEARQSALSSEPNWDLLPAETPESVRLLLARCLKKDPSRRGIDAASARRTLAGAAAGAPNEKAELPKDAAESPRSSLPAPLTTFVGRSRELEACAALLWLNRLLTLTGVGGAGKTRLSLALAERVRAEYPGGVYFVDLAPLTEGERVVQSALAAAGVVEAPDRSGAEVLADVWRHSEVLLILDNCEHLTAASAELVASLLSGTQKLRVIATSREPLQISGEQTYPVPPLEVRRSQSAASTHPSESARLFADRARAVSPGFALTPESRIVVEEICADLDGIPLAVELAAARAHVLSLPQIQASLADRLEFLTGSRRVAKRHQTLRWAIDWSFNLLGTEERAFFAALSVFAGGFTQAAAEAIAAPIGDASSGAIDLLRQLVDKSLVLSPTRRSHEHGHEPPEEPRFQMLEMLRGYAAERLTEAGDEEEVRDRHLAYFLKVAEEASPQLTGGTQAACLKRLEADHENFLTALGWCDRRGGRDEEALRLAGSLWRFWLARSYLRVGRSALAAALTRADASAPSSPRGAALLGLGALAFHQNDWATAGSSYEAGGLIMEELGVDMGVGQALTGLGNVALGRGDYAAARERYGEALERFERAEHDRGKALVVSNLGRVAELEGDLTRARALYEQGLILFERIGDSASLAIRLSTFAQLCLKLGDPEACRVRLSEGLAIVRDLDEKRAGAYALERTAALAEVMGDSGTALRLGGASSALRERIASPVTPKEGQELASMLGRARQALGAQAEAAWEEGRGLSFDEAVPRAIEWLSRTPESDAASRPAGTGRAR